MDKTRKKGTALSLLLVVSAIFIGLGVFLDGEVLPPPSDTEKLIKEAEVQSSLRAQRDKRPSAQSEPSEVAQQLGRAIDAANQNETESAAQLEARVTESQALIEEMNQLLEEKKGGSVRSASSSEKLEQFNTRLKELQARLTELDSSQ